MSGEKPRGGLSYPKRPADALRALQSLEDETAPRPTAPPVEEADVPVVPPSEKPRNVVTSQNYNVTKKGSGEVFEGVKRIKQLSDVSEMRAHLNSRLTEDADELIDQVLNALRRSKAKKQAIVSAALEMGLRQILEEIYPPPKEEV